MNPPATIAVDEALVTAILDRLLPAQDELPAAGRMGLAPAVLADAATVPALAAALEAVAAQLPPTFAELPGEVQDDTLRAIEGSEPAAFAGVVNLAYNAYYTDRRVLELIERRTGYTARPPQPDGYELEPFDPAVLERTRQRAPFWRKA
jgi:hypothetical protein